MERSDKNENLKGEADLRAEPAATGQINQERKWISKRFGAERKK